MYSTWTDTKWGPAAISFLRAPLWTLFFRVAVSTKLPSEKLHQAHTSISAVLFDSSGRYIFPCLTWHCCLGLKNIGLDVVLCYSVLGTKESYTFIFVICRGTWDQSESAMQDTCTAQAAALYGPRCSHSCHSSSLGLFLHQQPWQVACRSALSDAAQRGISEKMNPETASKAELCQLPFLYSIKQLHQIGTISWILFHLGISALLCFTI